jgi:multimeric flavodoxin WrbA
MTATVYIVIYSLYGHIYTLAQEIQKGLEASGVQTKLYQGMFLRLAMNAYCWTMLILR